MKKVLAAVIASMVLVLAWIPTVGSAGSACTETGTSSADILIGTSGDDVLCGKGGGDTIVGRGGDDVLIGGPGADKMAGDRGDDLLKGGLGADWLYDTTGIDRLLGGDGPDSCVYADDGNAGDVVNGGAGYDGYGADAGDSTRNVEHVVECPHPPVPQYLIGALQARPR